MKLIDTKDAAGHVLCHDITQIIPGVSKGPVFKKGHVVTAEDIPVLLSVGKEHLYVWEKKEGMLHEDEAAEILREICMGEDPCMTAGEPSEGKIEIRAAEDGLFKLDRKRLKAVNSLGEMMIATIHGDMPVHKGQKLAGTRVIPLVIEEEKMKRAKEAAGDRPLFSLLPFRKLRYGLVVTGNEVAAGRIEDAFGPVLRKKLDDYGGKFMGQQILSDDREGITEAIRKFAGDGAELILVSGGMSVDPDDRTPGAIKDTGTEIISYGAPVLPGAMFLLSYLKTEGGEIPVLGLPGCIMYAKRTVFDLVLPRILAGERLSAEDLADYGEGGLCLGCEECHYPNCGFGK
ncbi:MAG: molybdopterin-binding protein [Lachnospiraceae bacterium]|nr:molybdopterin-binding protein [Lachnospiraceae bacterium]